MRNPRQPLPLPPVPAYADPPPWLVGGRRGAGARAFWAQLGREVEALSVRYPRALLRLPADWFAEAALTERLGALAFWRQGLDEGLITLDPRAELDFHEALERLRELLDERHRATLTGQIDHPQAPGDPGAQRACAEGRRAVLDAALDALPVDEPDVGPEQAFLEPERARLCPADSESAAP